MALKILEVIMSKTNVFLTILVVFIFSGCQSEQQGWNYVQRTNTLSAYRYFLHDYPEGEYSSKAQERIETLTYERARKENNLNSYKDYLKSYPHGRYVSQCKEKITAIQIKELAAQREEEAKRLQFNRGRLNILKQYEVNKTTEKQFQTDGWTASDPTYGKLGVTSWVKRKGHSRYVIGFLDLHLEPDADITIIGDFLQEIYESEMKEENTTYEGVWLRSVRRGVLPTVGVEWREKDGLSCPFFLVETEERGWPGSLAPTIQVCVLEFEGGVLKDIQFKKVSEIEEQ